jgi:tripartite-type tricarboxylate transporter receptor subunit TctC
MRITMKPPLSFIRIATFVIASFVGAAQAQDFPSKPMTLIVPFAAGGPSDAIARVVADHMGRTLGQSVVVENVAGAGGTAGAERVAKAAADGYTMLIHHSGLATAPSLYSNLRFDPKSAYEPLGLVNVGPMVVIAKKSIEAKTLQELFTWAKANADKVNVAHAGIGSSSHICSLLLEQAAGMKLNAVAYRGTGPAINDLIGGTIDLICDQATNAVPQIEGGTVKAFAVLADQRLSNLPDVPTSVEGGFPALKMAQYHGVYAPKAIAPAIAAKLNDALRKAVADPAVVAKFAAVGTVPFPDLQRTPQAHARYFADDIAAQAKAFTSSGLKPVDVK